MGKKGARRQGREETRSAARERSPEPRLSSRRQRKPSRSSSRGARRGKLTRTRSRSLSPLQVQLQALEYVSRGNASRLRKLMRRNEGVLNLAASDSQGRTLVHNACACGKDDIVALLLRRGAPAGLVDSSGDTPAHLAARAGHLAALAEVMQAPDAPSLDAPGAGGSSLRDLMARALGGRSGLGEAESDPSAAWAAGSAAQHAAADREDEEARWQRRLREECSDGEGDDAAAGEWGGHYGAGGGGGLGETDDEWASRLWREMQHRRYAAATAGSAAFRADLRAETARRAAEAAERSQRILQEEKAKDAEWRRRTVMAIEAGPSTTPLDMAAAKAMYDERWALLDASTAGSGAGVPPPAQQPLWYDDIPWPLEPPPPPGPAPLPAPGPPRLPGPPSVDALRDFLLSGATGPSDVKRRLRAELLRWHPDKFGARFGPRLEAAGRAHWEVALARVQQLAQVLTQTLAAPGGSGGARAASGAGAG